MAPVDSLLRPAVLCPAVASWRHRPSPAQPVLQLSFSFSIFWTEHLFLGPPPPSTTSSYSSTSPTISLGSNIPATMASRAARSVALLRASDPEGVRIALALVDDLGPAQASIIPTASSSHANVQDARQSAGAFWLAYAVKQLHAIPTTLAAGSPPLHLYRLQSVLTLAQQVLSATLPLALSADEATTFQLFARNIIQANAKTWAQALIGAAEACASRPASETGNRAPLPMLLEALSSDVRRTPSTYRSLATAVRALATLVIFPPSLSPFAIPHPNEAGAAATLLIDLHRTGSSPRPTDPPETWPTAAASGPVVSTNMESQKAASSYVHVGVDPTPAQGSTHSTATAQQSAGRVRNPTPSTLWAATIDAALGTVDLYLASLSSTLGPAVAPAWGSTFPLGDAAMPLPAPMASASHVKGQVNLLKHALYVLFVMLSAPAPAVVARLPLARAISWLASPLGSASVLGAGICAAAQKPPAFGVDAILHGAQVRAFPTLQISALLILGALFQRAGGQASLSLLVPSASYRAGGGTTPPLLEVLADLLPHKQEQIEEVHLVVLRLLFSLLSPPTAAPLGPDHPSTAKLADACQALLAQNLVQLPPSPRGRLLATQAAEGASDVLMRLAPILATASPDSPTTSTRAEDEPPKAPRSVTLTALGVAGVRAILSPSGVTSFASPSLLAAITRMLSASLQSAPGAVWAATVPGLASLVGEMHAMAEGQVEHSLCELKATLALVTIPRYVPVPEWSGDQAMETLLYDLIEAHAERKVTLAQATLEATEEERPAKRTRRSPSVVDTPAPMPTAVSTFSSATLASSEPTVPFPSARAPDTALAPESGPAPTIVVETEAVEIAPKPSPSTPDSEALSESQDRDGDAHVDPVAAPRPQPAGELKVPNEQPPHPGTDSHPNSLQNSDPDSDSKSDSDSDSDSDLPDLDVAPPSEDEMAWD